MAINMEDIMSNSDKEEDEEEEDEWQPEKKDKGRRGSRKAKATGVRYSPVTILNFVFELYLYSTAARWQSQCVFVGNQFESKHAAK